MKNDNKKWFFRTVTLWKGLWRWRFLSPENSGNGASHSQIKLQSKIHCTVEKWLFFPIWFIYTLLANITRILSTSFYSDKHSFTQSKPHTIGWLHEGVEISSMLWGAIKTTDSHTKKIHFSPLKVAAFSRWGNCFAAVCLLTAPHAFHCLSS